LYKAHRIMPKEKCCDINDTVQEFYNFLKAFITGKVSDKETAEDLVQEVMMRLVEAHNKSTKIGNMKAWLFQVTRNTLYDYYKKNKKEETALIEFVENEQFELQLSQTISKDVICPMITILPEKYATALELSDLEKIPQKEIAKQLNLSLSATKMRIQRGRAKLRELFIECCEIDYDRNGNFIGCTVKPSCKSLQYLREH